MNSLAAPRIILKLESEVRESASGEIQRVRAHFGCDRLRPALPQMPSGGSPITDVVVTYGESMAPPGYHRVTRDDVGVDLNKLTGGPPTYLWLQESRGLPYIACDHRQLAMDQG